MERPMLKLRPDAEPVRQGKAPGLRCGGHTCYAKDAYQSLLLRTLLHGPQPLDSLTALLLASPAAPASEAGAALVLAGFILDFEYCLES